MKGLQSERSWRSIQRTTLIIRTKFRNLPHPAQEPLKSEIICSDNGRNTNLNHGSHWSFEARLPTGSMGASLSHNGLMNSRSKELMSDPFLKKKKNKLLLLFSVYFILTKEDDGIGFLKFSGHAVSQNHTMSNKQTNKANQSPNQDLLHHCNSTYLSQFE